MSSPGVQLVYALATRPFPLQASPADGKLTTCSLTIEAANPAPAPDQNPVALGGIQVTLPVGEGASDLTPDASGVQPVAPTGWKVQPVTAPGVFAFVPARSTTIDVGAGALVFVLDNVTVNRSPGPVVGLEVAEGSGGTEPPYSPTVDLDLTKFPSGWGSVDFWATPPDVDFGQSVTLHWSGPPGATYEIEYATRTGVVNVPAPGQPPLASAGVWPGANDPPLEPAETTVFTLTVTEKVAGVQYASRAQTTVSVVPPGPQIDLFAGTLRAAGDGYELKLEWRASHAEYCTLSEIPLQVLQTHGTFKRAAAPPWGESYALEAVSADAGTATATLTSAWRVWSTTAMPSAFAPAVDLALSPDGTTLYVAATGAAVIYGVPAESGQPLDELAVLSTEGGWGATTTPRIAAAPVVTGFAPPPAQSFWATWGPAGIGTLALVAPQDGHLTVVAVTTFMSEDAISPVASADDGSGIYVLAGGRMYAFGWQLGLPLWEAACEAGAGLAATDEGHLYVAGDGAVTAYAPPTGLGARFGLDALRATGTLSLGGRAATDVAVAHRTLFAAVGSEVVVADAASMGQLGAPIAVSADRLAVAPDGLRLYALSASAQTISVLAPTPLGPAGSG